MHESDSETKLGWSDIAVAGMKKLRIVPRHAQDTEVQATVSHTVIQLSFRESFRKRRHDRAV